MANIIVDNKKLGGSWKVIFRMLCFPYHWLCNLLQAGVPTLNTNKRQPKVLLIFFFVPHIFTSARIALKNHHKKSTSDATIYKKKNNLALQVPIPMSNSRIARRRNARFTINANSIATKWLPYNDSAPFRCGRPILSWYYRTPPARFGTPLPRTVAILP